MDANDAWRIAKEWLRLRGYGQMYANSLKFVAKEGTLWHVIAKFSYYFEDKQADVWVDDETKQVVKYKVEP